MSATMPKVLIFLCLFLATTLSHSAEEYVCKQVECRSGGADCHKEGIEDDPFLRITINKEGGKTYLKECRKKICSVTPIDRVEVRGLCRRRGSPRLLPNDPDYCGDYVKFYIFDTQADLQIFPDSNDTSMPPGYMIYNQGNGVQLFGTCKGSGQS